MAKGINEVTLVGNLGADPEIRYTPGGDAVCNLRVATSESWKDKNTGEKREHTEWHRCACFGKLAEVAGEYLHKGSRVYLRGKNKTNEWEKNGEKRFTTQVVFHDLIMMDPPPSGGAQRPAQRQGAPAHQRHDPQAPPAQQGGDDGAGFFDDDIPF